MLVIPGLSGGYVPEFGEPTGRVLSENMIILLTSPFKIVYLIIACITRTIWWICPRVWRIYWQGSKKRKSQLPLPCQLRIRYCMSKQSCRFFVYSDYIHKIGQALLDIPLRNIISFSWL